MALMPFWLLSAVGASGSSVPSVDEVLNAGTDLWGEAALRQPDGPFYRFFADLLPPLRYVDAEFGRYPIVVSSLHGQQKQRLASDGSGVNLRANRANWHDASLHPMEVWVGDRPERFGADLDRLIGPHLADGWMPIYRWQYHVGECKYHLEAFAAPKTIGGAEAVYVQVKLLSGGAGNASFHFPSLSVTAAGDRLVEASGGTRVLHDDAWTWDSAAKRLTSELKAGMAARCVFFGAGAAPDPGARTELDYDRALADVQHFWQTRTRSLIQIETPDPVINRAWRASLVTLLTLLHGDTMMYSALNQYACTFEAECGDAVFALGLYGEPSAKRYALPTLERPLQHGVEDHDRAYKIRLMLGLYWLTRDDGFLRRCRQHWQSSADELMARLEPETGLLPKSGYCGDIGTPVNSLNSNCAAWRALRDLAALLRESVDSESADRYAKAASKLREAILDAVDKSVDRTSDPPFVPMALFGFEKRAVPITSTGLSAYWNLIAPYALESGALLPRPEYNEWIIRHVREQGGLCMGQVRFDANVDWFANRNALDDLYSLRYVLEVLRRDEPELAAVSLYGKLAQALTRDTFLGAEGTGLRPLDRHGRPMYLPPNSSSTGYFLTMLRYVLVQDWDLNDDGIPETLRLGFAVPRHWMRDGQVVSVKNAPTAFGLASYRIESQLSRGRLSADVVPPPRVPYSLYLRFRLPDGWHAVRATVNGRPRMIDGSGAVELTGLREPLRVVCEVDRQ